MKIPQSREREQLGNILRDSYPNPLANLHNMRLLERSRFPVPEDGQGYVFKEPFVLCALSDPVLARDILGRRGHILTQNPNDGDIVAYVSSAKKESSIMHWGILERGMVRSQFPSGDFYLHSLEMVPAEFGDEVIFFTKQKIAC